MPVALGMRVEGSGKRLEKQGLEARVGLESACTGGFAVVPNGDVGALCQHGKRDHGLAV